MMFLFALLTLSVIVFLDDRLQAGSPRTADIFVHPAGNIFGASISLEGGMENAMAKGAVNLFDEEIDFNGRVSLSGEKAVLKDFDLWSIGVVITRGEVDFKTRNVYIKAGLNHAYFRGMDIAGDITISGRYQLFDEAGGRLSFEGEITAEKTIINQRPFDDARMVFKIENDTLQIRRIYLGKKISAFGRIDLKNPAHPLDIVITADNVNITQLLMNLRAPDIKILSGILNAKIILHGPCALPYTKCRLDIRRGNLGNILFKSMSAALSGHGTLLKIEDSRINTQNGHLTMIGDFDLANIGKRNIFEDVQVLTDDNNVFLDGWDIIKHNERTTIRSKSGNGKVEAVKNVSDDINVGFRTYVENGDANPDPRNRASELELEYKMFKNGAVKMKLGDEGEFVGVEHREEF